MNYSINRERLLGILRENRDNHGSLYEEAKANYLKAAKEALQDRFVQIEEGKVIDLYVSLPVPENHTRDYDRTIRMLEMDTRDVIPLTDTEAKTYVEDQWSWRRAWIDNTASYTGSADFYAAEVG